MTANGALQTVVAAEAPSLAGKLEFAILSVLIHYNGSYEETLSDWYSALRLGLPELTHYQQVRDIFKRLSAEGIVELNKSEPFPTTAPMMIDSSPQGHSPPP